MNANVNPSAAFGARRLPGVRVSAPWGGVGTPLDGPPRPGESYTNETVFDPPPGAGLSGEGVHVRA